ncbi:MAG: methyltransferase domain-containing protein [Patescibacteria group bacterium]|jgi:ubiquinone/menaquinone biosynthesis C-methylase UbiE
MNKVSGGNVLIDPQTIIEKGEIGDRMQVADLGCGGSGHFVFPIANVIGENGIIYAVDILKNNLANIERRAKQDNLKQVKTVWSNLEIFKATKIESASLDAGLLINVLYQSNKREEMIREAVRMVKRGGKLLIVDWKKVRSPFGPSLEERVNKENLAIVCQRLGMELLEEFNTGEYHFGLVFLKH